MHLGNGVHVLSQHTLLQNHQQRVQRLLVAFCISTFPACTGIDNNQIVQGSFIAVHLLEYQLVVDHTFLCEFQHKPYHQSLFRLDYIV